MPILFVHYIAISAQTQKRSNCVLAFIAWIALAVLLALVNVNTFKPGCVVSSRTNTIVRPDRVLTLPLLRTNVRVETLVNVKAVVPIAVKSRFTAAN